MSKLKAVERRIANIEGFEVTFWHTDGRDVRSDKEDLPMYSYRSAAKNDVTVGQWRELRFNQVYPGFEITVSGVRTGQRHTGPQSCPRCATQEGRREGVRRGQVYS